MRGELETQRAHHLTDRTLRDDIREIAAVGGLGAVAGNEDHRALPGDQRLARTLHELEGSAEVEAKRAIPMPVVDGVEGHRFEVRRRGDE